MACEVDQDRTRPLIKPVVGQGGSGRNQLRASARFAKPAPVGRWNHAEITTDSLTTDVGQVFEPSLATLTKKLPHLRVVVGVIGRR